MKKKSFQVLTCVLFLLALSVGIFFITDNKSKSVEIETGYFEPTEEQMVHEDSFYHQVAQSHPSVIVRT